MSLKGVLRGLAFFAFAVSVHAASPTIAPLADETTYVDHPILVELPVHDAETPTNQLTFTLSTSNPALVNTNKNVLFRWFTDGGVGYIPRWYMTLAPTFGLTGTATNTITVSDGTNTASTNFVLTVLPPPNNAVRVANTNQILLPPSGVASASPSTVNVSGLLGKITNIVVTFSHLTHTNPNDLHMLLVSPAGQKMVFWSKVGGGGAFGGTPPDHHVTNITATITDAAPDWSPLPPFYYIWTEKFRPGDYAASEGPTNNFPAPAPAGPYAPVPGTNAFQEAFQGFDANGTWSLYIYDDAAPYGGRIDDGWSLTVLTAGALPPTITSIANQTILTNTSTAALPFTINDPDTAVGSLTLSKASSNSLLIPTNNISIGGSGSNRTVTVTPAPGLSGTSTITISVSDGTNVVNAPFLVNVITGFPQTVSFTNANGIGLADTNGALPYPATINVAGLSGIVSNVTVTLRGFNQTWAADMDMLLVGPAGQKMILMSDVGDGVINNATYTFADSAASAMSASPQASGTYRPTDLTDASPLGDTFPSPAPAAPYGTNLAVFNGTNPNGTWSLYIHDDGPGDTGTITNGWSLDITTYPAANTPPTLSGISSQATVVNIPTAAIPFTISDAETAASSLVITAFTSNAGLVSTNNIVIGGSGSNRTVTVTPTLNQLGTVTISLNVSDGTLVASNSFVLTVNPASLVVTASNFSRAYGLTNPVLTGSVAGLQAGDSITANFTTTGNTNSPVGTYPIAFTLADPGGKLGKYMVTTNNGTLTVTPAALTVTANSTNKVYGTTRIFLNTEFAITSGTLYNGNTLTSATLTSAGTNAAATVGTYPITPSAAVGSGLSNYSITYSNGTLTVDQAALSVTASNTNKVYGTNRVFTGTEFAITSGALVNGNTLTGVTLTSAGTNAAAAVGAYPITPSAAVGSGLANYAIAYNNGTLTVTPAALTVTANNANKVYGTNSTFAGTEFAITSGALFNGNTLTNVTLTSAGTNAAAVVGTYPITPSVAIGAGLTNYSIAYNDGTLTVTPAALTVAANNANKVYGTNSSFAGTEFAITSGALFNGNTMTSVTLTSAGTNAAAVVGTYPITPSAALGVGLTNYTIAYTNGTLTVLPAALTVAANSTNKVYGGSQVFAGTEFTIASGALFNGNTLTSVTLASAGANAAATVGAYPITVSTAQGLGLTNYTINYASGTLTVTPAALTVAANSTNKVYGSSQVFAGTEFTIAGGTLFNGNTLTSVTLASSGSAGTAPVGSYAITAANAVGSGLTNYTIAYSSGTLTVGPASLSVTAGSTNKVYGATLDPTDYGVAGLLNGDTVTNVTLGSMGSVSNAPVGSYPIAASSALGAGLTNYTIGYTDGVLTVGAANLIITAGSTNKVYGTTLIPTDYSVAGLLHGHTVTNVTLTTSGSVSNAPVGAYAVNATAALGTGLTNYTIGYSGGTLTVSAANLLITAGSTNKVYGTTLNLADYGVTGLVGGDSVTNVTLVSPGAVSTAPAGSYAINASSALGVGLTNYTIGYNDGTLTVGAAPLLVTAGNTNKVYGATLAPSAYSVTGLLNSDSVTSVTLASAGSVSNATAGGYAINASAALGAGLTNYSISYSNGTLTVAKAPLLVTADNKSRIYGQANPVLTVSYSGFVNGEGTNVLNALPGASTAATTASAPGGYPITIAGGSDDNYVLTLVDGTLTITGPGATTITTVEFVGGNLRIAGTGDANVSYNIEASADLSTWALLGTTSTDGAGVFEYFDTTTAGAPMRFYRVVTP